MLQLLAAQLPLAAQLLERMDYDHNHTRRDGTGPTGAGIFKRYTVRDLIHGHYDSLFDMNVTSTIYPGYYNLYPTLEDQMLGRATLGVPPEPAFKYAESRMTGKSNITDAGRLISSKGVSNYTASFVRDMNTGMVRQRPWPLASSECSGSHAQHTNMLSGA
eukprot:2968941-Prymnesium_polylepis.2